MVSIVVDWRFARHVDFYAGVCYSQRNGGLANGFILSNQQRLTWDQGGIWRPDHQVSTFDPGIGLRYQF